MSTTFDVFPGIDYIPTFAELIELSNTYLNQFLRNIGISDNISLSVQLHKNDESLIKDNILDLTAQWDDEYYAWFYVEGIPGGTDAYFWAIEDIDVEIWEEEIKTNANIKRYESMVNKSISIGYRWNFRRSAGQPGIIALSYGLIAAALTKLTEGFIYSDDSAWDYSFFPSSAENFLEHYFKPEKALHNDYKIWAEECIRFIHTEIRDRKV